MAIEVKNGLSHHELVNTRMSFYAVRWRPIWIKQFDMREADKAVRGALRRSVDQ